MIPSLRGLLILDPEPSSQKGGGRKHNKNKLHYIPNDSLRVLHAYALRKIEEYIFEMPSATGWIKGRGSITKDHILSHTNGQGFFHEYWYITDIKDAFRSVNLQKMSWVLCNLFPYYDFTNWPDMKEYLKKYFFAPGGSGLAEGYSTSPKLFNIYAEKMIDQHFRELCTQYNISYTRFGDDLIFTSDTIIGKKKKKALLSILRVAEFTPNDNKTHSFNLNKLKEGKIINGVGIRNTSTQAEIFLPRSKRKKLEMLLYLFWYDEAKLNPRKIEGLMGWFNQVTDSSKKGKRTLNTSEEKILKYYNRASFGLKELIREMREETT
ncbi:hypothetical protein COB64_03060 [Candidatus Wolfebacteria bacterium]|nr:MAG: hypothetical protein COB64_03060 [Candidatus Wolfebacteria bacterium]